MVYLNGKKIGSIHKKHFDQGGVMHQFWHSDRTHPQSACATLIDCKAQLEKAYG